MLAQLAKRTALMCRGRGGCPANIRGDAEERAVLVPISFAPSSEQTGALMGRGFL